MAINKKNFRTIVVENTTFYWKVKTDGPYLELLIKKSQDSNFPGVLTYFHQSLSSNYRLIVSPGLVRQVILFSLSHGWTPEIKSTKREDNFIVNSPHELFVIDEKNKFVPRSCTNDCQYCGGRAG